MQEVVKQEQVNTVLITPSNISFNSRDIKIENKNGLVEINVPGNYRGELKYIVSGEGNINEKSVINVGDNSELIIYEEREGEIKGQGEIKLNLGNNSKVSLVEVQNLGYKSDVYLNKKIECNFNSRVSREVICLGCDNIKIDCNIYLEQESNAEDREVFFGDKEQRFELNTNIIHKGIKSKGSVLVRGILKDKGYCYSHGILRINKEAQQANTYLAEHVLLLSKESKAQAIPALEIEADNVQAGHAASVTQIDNDQIFYMLTRGLEEKEARKMIVQGFLGAILTNVSDYVKEKWDNLFEEKWNK